MSSSPLHGIETTAAAAAIGPYSQAVRHGGWVFVSGQIPLDPGTGEVVSGAIEDQTHRVLQSLQAILQEAGSSMENVVRTTVYLTDLGDFAAMNAVYATYMGSPPPARATVQVAALPKGVQVEIDAIAVVADAE